MDGYQFERDLFVDSFLDEIAFSGVAVKGLLFELSGSFLLLRDAEDALCLLAN